MSIALNDVMIGKIVFEDEKSCKDFQNAYETLPKDQKWGYALLEMVDDENNSNN